MSTAHNFKNVSPAAQQDIEELDRRITAYRTGQEDEERFKLYRLTRGVYGQRQTGVQMFRIKIPFGHLTSEQLVRIADVSDQYATGNLHLTTRQNIQLHYVKLEDSPAVWTALAQKGITAREACGNTVRNLTASANAGIDPDEPFDVSPYVQAAFEYFLRNPICQEMGRKIKPAFSSSEKDSAFTYFHDFGFIPRIQLVDGQEQRGFKVVIGGGLGAVSMVAQTVYEFLAEDRIIPFMEACIRVFDRYGEREKRMKARMKFLLKKLGFDGFMKLVNEEQVALKHQTYPIDTTIFQAPIPPADRPFPLGTPVDTAAYELWLQTNVYEQKQAGYYAAQLRVPLGDLSSDQARALAAIVPQYAADDIRVTINQGLLLRFIQPEALPHLYNALHAIDLSKPGFDSIADITACPGTDTCALGVTNSTGLAKHLEEVIEEEYADLIAQSEIRIKISGCMNSCGQHMAAHIGFHGSSIKNGTLVLPAMQVVLGGGVSPDGTGFVADKVVKLPTKRIPDALRTLLADYEAQSDGLEYFNHYVRRQGKRYFYSLLKPLADAAQLLQEDYFDWGQEHHYVQEIGVGECAGVTLDVVGTIIADAHEKIEHGKAFLQKADHAGAIYNAYTAFVVGAKALLLSQDVKCNTHRKILDDFQTHFVDTGRFDFTPSFPEHVLQINQNEPSLAFAREYLRGAADFVRLVIRHREAELVAAEGVDKVVIGNYYNA